MAWPDYQFLTLSEEEKALRRASLDRYALLAQLSAVVPCLLVLLYRVGLWVWSKRRLASVPWHLRNGAEYDAIPDSPALKTRRLSGAGTAKGTWRKAVWWLGEDVAFAGMGWGQRDLWLGGAAWTLWLLVLCVVGTGTGGFALLACSAVCTANIDVPLIDYLHLTKRFGIVAASQLPILYALSLKAVNPFSIVLRTSHERLNRWHRVLGRIVYLLLCLHAALYLRYFIGVGIFPSRLFNAVVLFGVMAFMLLTLLFVTAALSFIRDRISFRLFFLPHLAAAFALPVLLYLHATPGRPFLAEALALFVFDLAARKLGRSATCRARVERIPGTDLLKISARAPAALGSARWLDQFRDSPGAHVYLSIPAAARPSANPAAPQDFLLFELLYNPFTVAGIDERRGEVLLVARHRGGPVTRQLARFAAEYEKVTNSAAANHDKHQHEDADYDGEWEQDNEAAADDGASGKFPLTLEGPYGAAKYFPALSNAADFDRVLLVAGGVGATFALPLYRHLVADIEAAGGHLGGGGADGGGSSGGGEGARDVPTMAKSGPKVELVWAVRTAGEATWAMMSWDDGSRTAAAGASGAYRSKKAAGKAVAGGSPSPGKSLMDDENVRIYLTGDILSGGGGVGVGSTPNPASGAARTGGDAAVEMSSMFRRGGKYTARHNRRRPDLQKIVDDAFRHGSEERVAVLVCGPPHMAAELRRHVGVWVAKGRSVFWHDESFAY